MAIEQGCDVIEPDLLPSADGLLHCRHDLFLSRSTDIARHPDLWARRRVGPDDRDDGWIDDFSAAELARLRAIQPWPQRGHERDGVYALPRFGQALDLLLMERRRRERPLLIYPELKHPSYLAARGIDVVAALQSELAPRALTGPAAPVLVQCFEAQTLERVRAVCGSRVVLLSVDLPDVAGPDVHGYGVSKQALLTAAGADFIAAAHARGRLVHAWTFRDDQLAPGVNAVDECASAYAAGCDGLFSDFPATALRGRALALRGTARPAIRIQCVTGADVAPYVPALAQLRMRVFREWPYRYDGDLAYEAQYLQTYVRSPRCLFVLAFDGDHIVGCSTALPLSDEAADCQAPFRAAGMDLTQVCYFGESVLDPAWRGQGIGHRFFDAREAHARTLGCIRWTAFCAVERAADDPRRPAAYRPLDAFWHARGYVRRPELCAQFSWRELGEHTATSKRMVYWLRACPP